MKETEEEAYFSQPDVKPSVRPAQIAKADCILSHPGGLLGKVFCHGSLRCVFTEEVSVTNIKAHSLLSLLKE